MSQYTHYSKPTSEISAVISQMPPAPPLDNVNVARQGFASFYFRLLSSNARTLELPPGGYHNTPITYIAYMNM